MATVISSTQLDFGYIKGKILEFMKRQSEFEDYDFEASGLSVMADVLAYNTHQNALVSNFSLNETYLQTAQLRPSLVNLASNFAYTPRSRSASQALLNISVNLTGESSKPEEIYLPAGSAFTTELDDITYTFRTTQEYTGYIDDDALGIYTFRDVDGNLSVPVYEGTEKVKTFIVNTALLRQIYVIPDASMDLSTLKVRVFEDTADTVGTAYLSPTSLASGFTAQTKLYLPFETFNGFYEVNFGDGTITGEAPEPGNIIRATYLSTNGAIANGADAFTPSTGVKVGGVSFTPIVTTASKSALGAEKENIESIRINAPLSYLAQGRLVTPNDYIAVISNVIPGIKSMNAWGGEDDVPAKYGKTLISIIYEDDVEESTKTTLEARIASQITDNLSIASIETEVIQPDFTYLNLTTNIKYDTGVTALTRRGLQDKVSSTIREYFSSNLGKFNNVFRKSKLLSTIDGSDGSILSSEVSVKMENRFEPVYNTTTLRYVAADYQINFLNTLDVPNKLTPIITSDNFVYNGKVAYMRNRIGEKFSTILEVVDVDGNILVTNVGYYTPSKGTVNLTGFTLTSISSGNDFLRIITCPADDNNIKPLRNHVIGLGFNIVRAADDVNAASAISGVTN